MVRLMPRLAWSILAITAIAVGLLSVLLTDWLHLDPCYLCILQRLLILVVGALALCTALLARVRPAALALGVLTLSAAVTGAIIAGYQSWLQLQPSGSVTCTGSKPTSIELFVEWLGQHVPSLFLATGFCEEEGLRMLGMTLANWSLICFALLVAGSIWAIWKSR